MKRLRNVIGMIAVCGMTAFFTGCGDDNNNNDNSGTTTIAPSSLNGQSYNISDLGGGVAGSISFANNTYTISQPGATEVGTFTATRSGNTWTVNNTTGAEGAQSTSVLTLNFSGSTTGTYTLQRPGQPAVSGSFAPMGASSSGTTTSTGTSTSTGTTTGTSTSTSTSTSTGTSTGTTTSTGTSTSSGSTTGTTTSTGTSTSTGTTAGTTTSTGTSTSTGTTAGTTTSTGTSTSTGTTTSTGTSTSTGTTTSTGTSTSTGTTTSTGTSTSTGTTTGTVAAPATLATVNVHVDQGVLGGGANYTIHLTGGTSGNFNIDSGSVGSGTFTYTPNGNSARLLLNYTGDFNGDFDDMTLFFNSAPGGTGNTFSGNQRAGTQSGPMSGTFTY